MYWAGNNSNISYLLISGSSTSKSTSSGSTSSDSTSSGPTSIGSCYAQLHNKLVVPLQVGPNYAHAEARKSPVVDGMVQRDERGKEIRYPVLLSPNEKYIAHLVTIAFQQRMCGLDLLRSQDGGTYVCDVNGWSFVKNSQSYYTDAGEIMREIIEEHFPKRVRKPFHGP